jgi:hypothetical protein
VGYDTDLEKMVMRDERFNAGEDPEQEAVRFYPAMSDLLWLKKDPHTWAQYGVRGQTEDVAEKIRYLADKFAHETSPDDFYNRTIQNDEAVAIDMAKAAIELAWHRSLQPEYKVWPAAIAALSATSVEIDCKHFRLPFPSIALRLPEGFVREGDGPAIESVFCSIIRNVPGGSYPTTSMNGGQIEGSLLMEGRGWSSMGERVPAVLIVDLKYKDKAHAFGDSHMLFTLGLVEGQTIAQRLAKLAIEERATELGRFQTAYVPSPRLALDLFSVAIGTAFLATSRIRREKPIVARDKNPRPERRRFEKEHGVEQPTFAVGRSLLLPRDSGVPTPGEAGEQGPGEGTGRELRHSHFRTGHMRYQPYGSKDARTYELIFVEPTIVRPYLMRVEGSVYDGDTEELRPNRIDVEPGVAIKTPWGPQLVERVSNPTTDQDVLYNLICDTDGYNDPIRVPEDEWLLHLTASRTQSFARFTKGRPLSDLYGGQAGSMGVSFLSDAKCESGDGPFLIQFAWSTTGFIYIGFEGKVAEETRTHPTWALSDVPTYSLLFRTNSGVMFPSSEGRQVIFRSCTEFDVVPVMASFNNYVVLETGERFGSMLDLVKWADGHAGIRRQWAYPIPGSFRSLAEVESWSDGMPGNLAVRGARRRLKEISELPEVEQVRIMNEILRQL